MRPTSPLWRSPRSPDVIFLALLLVVSILLPAASASPAPNNAWVSFTFVNATRFTPRTTVATQVAAGLRQVLNLHASQTTAEETWSPAGVFDWFHVSMEIRDQPPITSTEAALQLEFLVSSPGTCFGSIQHGLMVL